jgi:tetratricopeptide (TPR) repeat protein
VADTRWRVFVSHTSELRDYPRAGSYVNAVERAISACGHVIVDMKDFPAADKPPADLCAERVRDCDVYVGLLGTRYGSPVRDKPEVSYTELEFDTATEAGLKRLVFLLDDDAEDVGIPPSGLIDHEYGARQAAFRRRVRESRLVTQEFTDPATLGQLVERSLRELAEAYGDAGRTSEAITLHEQTLAARERTLGPDHPDTLDSRNNLAIDYQDAGRLNEAITLHEQTLAACERTLGSDHPDTLNSRCNLADAYRDAGREEHARRLES